MEYPASECGQFLMLGVPGPELDAAYENLVREVSPGGFILFSRNLESPAGTTDLINQLINLCPDPPIIAIDEEGGRVSRMRSLGVRMPGAARLAAAADPHLIDRHGKITAGLLKTLGFNLNLAPVLDLSTGFPEADGTLRARCWGSTPDMVLPMADTYLHALHRGRMPGCAKHFPTYRSAACDPHDELPRLEGTLDQMLNNILLPWLNLLPGLSAIMTAHITLPDEPATHGLPASLSPHVITGFLRGQLGYDGLVLTDDLDMGAIRRHMSLPEAAAAALAAGNDMILVCHHPEEAPEIMRHMADVPQATRDDAAARIRHFRRKLPKPAAFSSIRWDEWLAEAGRLEQDTPQPELDLIPPESSSGSIFAVDRT